MRRSGCCHVDPVPGAGAADITIVRPQPEFVKKKAAARRIRSAARAAVSRARKSVKMGNFIGAADAAIGLLSMPPPSSAGAATAAVDQVKKKIGGAAVRIRSAAQAAVSARVKSVGRWIISEIRASRLASASRRSSTQPVARCARPTAAHNPRDGRLSHLAPALKEKPGRAPAAASGNSRGPKFASRADP